MLKDQSYYIYIVTNINKTLYIGMTNNLERRIKEHRFGLCDGFTKKYKIYKLIYFEQFTDVKYAIHREKEIKKWRREKKVILIEKMNPDWRDLYNIFNK